MTAYLSNTRLWHIHVSVHNFEQHRQD